MHLSRITTIFLINTGAFFTRGGSHHLCSKSKVIEDAAVGKFIYIDNWATWCLPCIEGIPASKELAIKYKDNIQVIFISIDEDFGKWRDFVVENGLKNNSFFVDGGLWPFYRPHTGHPPRMPI